MNEIIKKLKLEIDIADYGGEDKIRISVKLLKDVLKLLEEYKRQDGCPCTHCMEWECDEVCEEYKKWRDT